MLGNYDEFNSLKCHQISFKSILFFPYICPLGKKLLAPPLFKRGRWWLKLCLRICILLFVKIRSYVFFYRLQIITFLIVCSSQCIVFVEIWSCIFFYQLQFIILLIVCAWIVSLAVVSLELISIYVLRLYWCY